jgi:Transposase DDE domain group 1
VGRSSTTKRGPMPAPEVRTDDTSLTRFAGMVPFVTFCSEVLELPQRLALAAKHDGRQRKHTVHHVLFAFLIGAVLGEHRLRHLELLGDDPVLLKFLRLASWPVRKVFSAAMGGVSTEGVAHIAGTLCDLGLRNGLDATHAVLDFDSSALICFGEQERAVFGYNGKGRNRRRHFPLVASIGDGRGVVNAKYRGGEGIGADEQIAFFAETVAMVRSRARAGVKLMLRADSGFWSSKVCGWLLEQNLPFACSLPLHAGVKLALMTARFTRVDPGDEDIESAVIAAPMLGYPAGVRIIAIRRQVHDASAPPPGKVVHGDERWRYQAIITSLDWAAADVWRFYNDRGDCERVFKVGKHALGLGCVVSHDFRTNEVAFLLRLLAFNADLLFQANAEHRAVEAKQPSIKLGLVARQPRFFRQAGRLLREHNRWVLRVPKNRRLADLWAFYAPELLRRHRRRPD